MTKNETTGDDGMDQSTDQVNTSEDVQKGKDQESCRKRRANFYEAALKGEWNKAEEILKDYPDYVGESLSGIEDTALHVAARAGRTEFVKNLIMSKYMTVEVLKKKNNESNTVFSLAAISGNIQLLVWIHERYEMLAMIRHGDEMLPVHKAALLGHQKVVKYLYTATKKKLRNQDLIELLLILIDNDFYDDAVLMVGEFKKLAIYREKKKGKTDQNGEIRFFILKTKDDAVLMLREKKKGKTDENGETDETDENGETDETDENGEIRFFILKTKDDAVLMLREKKGGKMDENGETDETDENGEIRFFILKTKDDAVLMLREKKKGKTDENGETEETDENGETNEIDENGETDETDENGEIRFFILKTKDDAVLMLREKKKRENG